MSTTSEAIAAAVPPELLKQVCSVFSDAQHHSAGHRKAVHALVRLQNAWEGSAEQEQSFFLAMLHCLHHVLAVKKNEELGGRLMRFFVGFLVRLVEGERGRVGGAGMRFVENMMLYALDNLDCKDRTVRARLSQIVVAGVNSVDELSDAVWGLFREKMIPRLDDRETVVRVHAIHAMARLQSLPIDDLDGEGDATTILDKFVELLLLDTQSEVRKAVLQQIDFTAKSSHAILSRSRDVDPNIRRLFYTQKIPEIDVLNLTVEQRDAVLKAGLTDRDEGVQRACVDMIFGHWLPRTNSNLVQFLTCLDVLENRAVAEQALCSFYSAIPKLLSEDAFSPEYFEHLTVETVFILRSYCQWLADKKSKQDNDQLVSEMLPELSVVVEVMSRFYRYLVAVQDGDSDGDEQARAEVDFILQELLSLALLLDTADEVGRRACLALMQELLVNLHLSDETFSRCVKVVRRYVALDEFIALMTELAADFKSVYQEDINDPAASPIQQDLRILAQLKAVAVVKYLSLEVPGGANTFTRYPVLLALLNELVIPAVNSDFAVVQAAGLECLALLCTVSAELACEYVQLFTDFYRMTTSEVKQHALKALFDVALVFGLGTLGEREYPDPNSADGVLKTPSASSLLNILATALYDADRGVQVTAAEGFTKLLLHNRLNSEHGAPNDGTDQVILGLFALYLHPGNGDAQQVRQCLTLFWQLYAFASRDNQERIARLLPDIIYAYTGHGHAVMDSIGQVFNQLLYLVNPANMSTQSEIVDDDWAELAVEVAWLIVRVHSDGTRAPLCPKLTACLGRIPLSAAPSAQPALKQLWWLTSTLLRILPEHRPTTAPLRKLATGLLALDDGTAVLDAADLRALQDRLHLLAPNAIQHHSHHPQPAPKQAPKARKQTVRAVENIMDNLGDMLE